ncbi:unnamed protein product [Thlaspi arvense]|uniref:protein-serine/threonine phosphatase n=1 Tax=Thlaspi arvense TaxID=13288 RepID=A0AAU9RIC6_THLAR|nr:unnamed protein product [Thlaspi arvense]
MDFKEEDSGNKKKHHHHSSSPPFSHGEREETLYLYTSFSLADTNRNNRQPSTSKQIRILTRKSLSLFYRTMSFSVAVCNSPAIFGVYDGHGGSRAAEFAAKNLCDNILGEIVSERNESNIEEAVKRGYLATDSEFLKEKNVKGGSCCVTALINDGNLVVANAGDCRAVLSVEGFAEALTSDHRPSRDDERNRIESSGGYVDTFHSVWRIQGSLAVSRGIGDAHLKQWIISEPETKILRINPQHEFLILASDGLWDKVSNQEAVDIARPFCIGTDQKREPLLACKKLVDLSVSRGSLDDISVMLIPLCRFI